MRFTAPEEYGLRCMLQMVRHDNGSSLTINELAEMEGLTPAYVAKLMRILRKARLVESTRGQKGGYSLTRPAAQVSVGEVLNALGGRLHSDGYCRKFTGINHSCVHTGDCSVKSLWEGLDRLITKVLEECKLTDLVREKQFMNDWVEKFIDRPVSELGIFDGPSRERAEAVR